VHLPHLKEWVSTAEVLGFVSSSRVIAFYLHEHLLEMLNQGIDPDVV
jgi:hypothetical protein